MFFGETCPSQIPFVFGVENSCLVPIDQVCLGFFVANKKGKEKMVCQRTIVAAETVHASLVKMSHAVVPHGN